MTVKNYFLGFVNTVGFYRTVYALITSVTVPYLVIDGYRYIHAAYVEGSISKIDYVQTLLLMIMLLIIYGYTISVFIDKALKWGLNPNDND